MPPPILFCAARTVAIIRWNLGSDFHPLFRNSHLATIAGNFWPRRIDEARFPSKRVVYRTDERNSVLVYEHQPATAPKGQLLLLHGLEGSSDAGYFASLTQDALTRGFGVHRANLRTCGGTEELCETMYHSGLTGDTVSILHELQRRRNGPVFVAGFSLGGNVALKMAGELGDSDLLAGVCAVSTPIDLAMSVRALDRLSNKLYARRFLKRLRERIRRKSASSPALYSTDGLDSVSTIWDFDDRFTAPLFGFGTAENYYETQSSKRFLERIRVPALIVAAMDDPLVPFEMYTHPAFSSNPALRLVTVKNGGHLGFLSRTKPRFWIDGLILDWMETVVAGLAKLQAV
jgi:predicted alpha/beta-fold hydrolase